MRHINGMVFSIADDMFRSKDKFMIYCAALTAILLCLAIILRWLAYQLAQIHEDRYNIIIDRLSLVHCQFFGHNKSRY